MTLFLSALLFLIFSEFFVLNFTVVLILYLTYFLFYVFYNNTVVVILPTKFLFKNYFLNSKEFLFNFFCKTTNSLNYVSYTSLKWKPLFRRSSYFGIYRSTRNQWLNK